MLSLSLSLSLINKTERKNTKWKSYLQVIYVESYCATGRKTPVCVQSQDSAGIHFIPLKVSEFAGLSQDQVFIRHPDTTMLHVQL